MTLSNFKRINKELTLRRVRFFFEQVVMGGYTYSVITDDTCDIRFANMYFNDGITSKTPYSEMRMILTADDFSFGRHRQRVVSMVEVAF